MLLLAALSQSIKAAKLVNPEQFDSWAENIELEPGEKHTETGLLIGHVRYTAVISLENCNANATLMMALILTWLKENDADRSDDKLPNPQLIVDVVDPGKNVSDVEINIDFKESIHLVPMPDGPISYNGKNYGVGVFDLDVATDSNVGHDADA